MNKVKTLQESSGYPDTADGMKKTVLVVEDDRTHRALMDKILKECGFETVLADNGAVALSKIGSGAVFDLILMDCDMPELNGFETVAALRKREVQDGLPHMPVIAFTSNRQPGDREECLAAGMDAYLSKDVWMPKWRTTLINNLQGLIAGAFDLEDFDEAAAGEGEGIPGGGFDLDAFDVQSLEHAAALLKSDLAIAVDEYFEDAAAYIREIRDGLDQKDAGKAARASHPLKSNSKGFGLAAVSRLSEAINTGARAGDLAVVERLLPQLQDAFRRAEKKLRDHIKRAGY